MKLCFGAAQMTFLRNQGKKSDCRRFEIRKESNSNYFVNIIPNNVFYFVYNDKV